MKLRCTACGKRFERFGTEFDPCPECEIGVLVGGSFAINGQSALWQDLNQVDPNDEIEEKCGPIDCNGDCENCLEEDESQKSDCKCNANKAEIEGCPKYIAKDSECFWVKQGFQESLSAKDVSIQEFMLATLDWMPGPLNPKTQVLDSLDIFIETFRDRNDDKEIIDEMLDYV